MAEWRRIEQLRGLQASRKLPLSVRSRLSCSIGKRLLRAKALLAALNPLSTDLPNTSGATAETDDAVMIALSMSMKDTSANVRQAAVQSLLNLARERKKTEHQFPRLVLQQLLERLSDQAGRVRSAARACIIQVALPGDRELVRGLAQKMQSRGMAIRRAASEVLQNLVIKFNEANDRSLRLENPEGSCLVSIQKLMQHPDPSVQRAALDAMQAISLCTVEDTASAAARTASSCLSIGSPAGLVSLHGLPRGE